MFKYDIISFELVERRLGDHFEIVAAAVDDGNDVRCQFDSAIVVIDEVDVVGVESSLQFDGKTKYSIFHWNG